MTLASEDREHLQTRRATLDEPSLYINRELSQLAFNERVLELAQDRNVPLLERLRFLAISTAILDEFFEIRVAGVQHYIAYDVGLQSADHLSAQDLLSRLRKSAHRLVEKQYKVLNNEILPDLEMEGIRIIKRQVWSDTQQKWIQDYFTREVLPVLTPVGLDPAHPFPRIVNKSLNFIVSLKGKDAFGRSSRAAVVQAPRVLPRLIAIPEDVAGKKNDFILLSSVIHAHVGDLFPGMKATGCYQFRVTRDSDLWVDEEEVDDLLNALKGELLSRRFGGATRLEIADNCTAEMESFLLQQFQLHEGDLYRVNGPVNLHRLNTLYDLVDRPDLKFRPFLQGAHDRLLRYENIFELIKNGDLLLHHPFQSIAPVVDFVRSASSDPKVLAIKMTVYRTGSESPFIEGLIEAARAGKEVTAVVELRARFDEAANITLATQLQEAGAKVVYGIVGYKAHSKMLMVVRHEEDGLRRYVHLSTGNYHTGTTRAYTDFGLLTCNPEIGEDVHNLFQQLTGLGKSKSLNKLLSAPFTLHEQLLKYVRAETAAALQGEQARIIVKVNALVEPQIIRALYEASQAGVQVDLIVRGMCCLRPGIPGISENIRVRSVLGRFLEHTRLFYFHAGGDTIVLCASADWMPRNFFRRVEACFPLLEKKLRRRVVEEGLLTYLEDNNSAWELLPDGSYRRLSANGAPRHCAQEQLLELLGDESPGSL